MGAREGIIAGKSGGIISRYASQPLLGPLVVHVMVCHLCFCRVLVARSKSQLDEDGDAYGMRTTVSMLNDEMEGLAVNGFSTLGFLLNNGLRVIGPCAIFPRSILQWNVCLVQHAATYLPWSHCVT